MRIEDVWEKWQPTVRRSRPERQTNAFGKRQRIQGMLLRRMNEETQEIEYTRVVNVIKGAPKPMVRVTTTGGRSIVATREHRFVTSRGWDTLGNAIDKNLLLAMEGTTRGKVERWDTPEVDEETERWRAVAGWEGLYEVSDKGRVRTVSMRQGVRELHKPRKAAVGANGYDVVSLSRGGKTRTYTAHRLVLEAFEGPCPPGHVARHLDGNRAHNRLENLTWGTAEENARDRIRHGSQQRLVTVFEEIDSVEYVGELPTYDLSVEGPYHNFIADGFVVHNSYNEMSARYIPVPDEHYTPAIQRIIEGASATGNKQATGTTPLDEAAAEKWLDSLEASYRHAEEAYRLGLAAGVPKELARLSMPVARYSRMRASANLRNWIGFLTLRQAANAQWEIRQYANAVGTIVETVFPRTWDLYAEGAGL
jgi:thymidylate synthase (FAD)